MAQRRVDAVAQVLRRVDQRAVEIEDQQPERIDGNGAEDAQHDSSLGDCGPTQSFIRFDEPQLRLRKISTLLVVQIGQPVPKKSVSSVQIWAAQRQRRRQNMPILFIASP